MAKKYCVIIGDIVQSKDLQNRRKLQRRFHNILMRINKDFSSQIVSKFVVTIGDEFQGVLKDPGQSYKIIDSVQEMFFPVKLRFGVGKGRISTKINKTAIGMDGPAFHHARDSIETAKNKKKTIIFKMGRSEKDLTFNALSLCLENIKDQWTTRQREVCNLYRKHKNQKKVAQFLKIKQPSVAKILVSSNWDLYSETEETLNKLLG